VDFSTPGLFDRAGNIKFQDFLQFSISARLIAEGRASELYDDRALADGIQTIVGQPTAVHLQYFYGPQVVLPFIPLTSLSFMAQAEIWVTFSLLLYFGCVYSLSKTCSELSPYHGIIAICAVAYPPVFHFFVRGHISAVVLLCFTAAFAAFLAHRNFIGGIALGFLVFKPQFLVGIVLVLALAAAWRIFAGVAVSAAAQLALAFLYFGQSVMRAYFAMLLNSATRPSTTELVFSAIQMHSLRSFWSLLLPWPHAVLACFLPSALAVIVMAAAVWKSSFPLALRFSALVLASVLVNPHLYVYDLVALVPVILLLADWAINNPQHPSTPALGLSLYLTFLLPLLGPLARWTHLQISVLSFVALLWLLWRISQDPFATAGHKLASDESRVV
jgi:glycosyl transferase family 87